MGARSSRQAAVGGLINDLPQDVKVLVLGSKNAGKSTLIKQMKIIYDNGFDEEYRRNCIDNVHQTVVVNIQEIQEIATSLGISFDKETQELINSMVDDKEDHTQIIECAKKVWKDKAMQQVLPHLSGQEYFLANLKRLDDPSYLPTQEDVLRCKDSTSTPEQHVTVNKTTFHFLDVSGQRCEKEKWIEYFEQVNVVIFMASMTDCAHILDEEEGITTMHEAMKLFGGVCNSKFSQQKPLLLLLNKLDQFQKKNHSKSLRSAFPEFQGSDGEKFIVKTFLEQNESGRWVHSHTTTAIHEQEGRLVLRYLQGVLSHGDTMAEELSGRSPKFLSFGKKDKKDKKTKMEKQRAMTTSSAEHISSSPNYLDGKKEKEESKERRSYTSSSSYFDHANQNKLKRNPSSRTNAGYKKDKMHKSKSKSKHKSIKTYYLYTDNDLYVDKGEVDNSYYKSDYPQEEGKPAPAVELEEKYNWTTRLQQVMDKPIEQRGTLISELSTEFVSVAKQAGETIIRERNLPLEQKTIPPSETFGGIAGGVKFFHCGILFKYAVDYADIYGSTEYAMKAASHEIKGLNACISCMIPNINFPLMTLITYRGFRLIASSYVPLDKSTLVYGSHDAGITIKNSSKEMEDAMKMIAKVLKLKRHKVGSGSQEKEIYGPVDIEGHIGLDSKMYIIDTARLFPPSTPENGVKGCFLYKHLRPEFLALYNKPLSSDAFSKFSQDSTNNQEVRDATNYLFNTVIPSFVQDAVARKEEISLSSIARTVHRAGINIRYLGRIRKGLLEAHGRHSQAKTILCEIIARTLKNILWNLLRESNATEDSAISKVIAEFVGKVFGKHEESAFWTAEVKQEINKRFTYALTKDENNDLFDLRTRVNMTKLFDRFQMLSAVKFDSSAVNDGVIDVTNKEPLLEARITPMYTIPRIEADALIALALQKSNEESKDAIALFDAAEKKYNALLNLKTDDYATLYNYALLYYNKAMVLSKSKSNWDEVSELFQKSFKKFQEAHRTKPAFVPALSSWGKTLTEYALLWNQRNDESSRKKARDLLLEANELFEKAQGTKQVLDSDFYFHYSDAIYSFCELVEEEELKWYEKCRKVLEQSAQLDKDESRVYIKNNLGCTYLRLAHLQDEVDHALLDKAEQIFKTLEEKTQGRAAYNLACVCAVRGEKEECKKWLQLSVDKKTVPDAKAVKSDKDLKNVHQEDWFEEIVAKLA